MIWPGEPIARAHHGSLAAQQRSVIEEQLKAGQIKALCATSTLELGIDMGAVDLVIQIEAPPSVASGMQRIGRAGHSVDAVSEGVLFPKYRADLVACAAVTRAMHEGQIESTRYPRNPLDVLCQQLVAIVAIRVAGRTISHSTSKDRRSCSRRTPDPASAEIPISKTLFRLVRGAAPFALLTRCAFEGVLDLLSGRYPSDEFAELRPRLTWDRIRNVVSARHGAARLAILNAGTIPDRGLYGVFLAHTEGKSVRVGELDEEMVFESHTNETFILGASTWRIEEITHDRVLVTPAPGEPGKMPFWKGDGPGRPLEFGRTIGELVRELRALPKPAALTRLVAEHDLDPSAAENLLEFLADQAAADRHGPDDRTIVIERVPRRTRRLARVRAHALRQPHPYSVGHGGAARIRAAGGPDVETLWGDDGFVLRFPDTERAARLRLVPGRIGRGHATGAAPAWLDGIVRRALSRGCGPRAAVAAPPCRSALAAVAIAQALLRSAQRCFALSVIPAAARGVSRVPARCLRHARAYRNSAATSNSGKLRVHVVDTRKPSPFASSLLVQLCGQLSSTTAMRRWPSAARRR